MVKAVLGLAVARLEVLFSAMLYRCFLPRRWRSSLMRTAQTAGCLALVLAVVACATRTPVVVITPKGERLPGFATTAVYTGKVDAGDRQCIGHYTGRIGEPVV